MFLAVAVIALGGGEGGGNTGNFQDLGGGGGNTGNSVDLSGNTGNDVSVDGVKGGGNTSD